MIHVCHAPKLTKLLSIKIICLDSEQFFNLKYIDFSRVGCVRPRGITHRKPKFGMKPCASIAGQGCVRPGANTPYPAEKDEGMQRGAHNQDVPRRAPARTRKR